jgi:hypothetical protein
MPQPTSTPNAGTTNAPANTSDTVPQQIGSYTKWNEWFVATGGLVQTMSAILRAKLPDQKAQTAIQASCHLLYDAAQGMNHQIVLAIQGLSQTPPVQPTVEFPPSALPDWPDTSKPNRFCALWSSAKPLLQLLDSKMVAQHPDDPLVVALGGFIAAGDKLVAVLSTYYPQWAPTA